MSLFALLCMGSTVNSAVESGFHEPYDTNRCLMWQENFYNTTRWPLVLSLRRPKKSLELAYTVSNTYVF